MEWAADAEWSASCQGSTPHPRNDEKGLGGYASGAFPFGVRTDRRHARSIHAKHFRIDREVLGGDRTVEVETQRLVTADRPDQITLIDGFHPFGKHGKVETMAKGNDGLIVLVPRQSADEGPDRSSTGRQAAP